jgi:hypothetical protein
VILTLYQPSAAIFDLCDTLALLSKGRLIYMGNVADASKFFMESPSMSLKLDHAFDNPADFLCSVSANLVCDENNEIVDAPGLERHYKGSSLCMLFIENHLKMLKNRAVSLDVDSEENPLRRLSVVANELNAQDDQSVMTDAADDWRYVSSVDTRSRSRSVSVSMSRRSTSMSVAHPTPASQSKRHLAVASLKLSFRKLMIPFLTSLHEIRSMNVSAQCLKAYVLNRRAFWALFKREKLVLGTTLMYLYLAVFTCLILKPDQENNPGTLTALSMFGAFLLLVSQLQYVFFLFNNQKVRLLSICINGIIYFH